MPRGAPGGTPCIDGKAACVSVTQQPLSVAARGLTKAYHTRSGTITANDGIDLDIPQGIIFGLLGPNGAGKTTFLKQILGLIRPTAGSLTVEGIDVAERPTAVKSLIGYMPQDRLAIRGIEVERAVRYTARLRGVPKAEAGDLARQVLGELDLLDYRDTVVDRLSGGITRMVSLALALVGKPSLLVLDEATNDLDPRRRRVIWNYLRQYIERTRCTCLLVTHNVHEAEQVLDEVAIINNGSLVASGSIPELRASVEQRADITVEVRVGTSHRDSDAYERLIATLGTFGTVSDPGQEVIELIVRRGSEQPAFQVLSASLGEVIDDFRTRRPTLDDIYSHVTIAESGVE